MLLLAIRARSEGGQVPDDRGVLAQPVDISPRHRRDLGDIAAMEG
jgi:hypothetical protein